MKALRIAAAAACIFAAAAPASAPASAADQNINITATVNGFCRIDGSLTPADDAVDWTGLVTTGFITATPTARTFAVICNRASDISLTSINGGMTTATAAATGFENVINYQAEASGFATIAAGSTATTAGAAGNETLGSTTRATPGSANIVVTLTPVVNTDPFVEGSYADTLRVTIEPQT